MAKEAERYIDVVLRSMDILELFLKVEKAQLKDIYAATGIQKNRIMRICGTLCSHGFLIFNESDLTYSLGPMVSFLGQQFDSTYSYLKTIQLELDKLAQITGETCHFCARKNTDRICLAIADGTSAIRFAISPGARSPLNASASGKVLLAFLPDIEKNKILESLPFKARTNYTVTNRLILEEQLKTIQQQGYAYSFRENYPNGAGLAAPVINQDGEVLGSLNIGTIAEIFDNGKYKKYIPPLLESSKHLSKILAGLKPSQLV